MSSRVAVVITGGCINHRKGYMNACISRAVHLAKVAEYKVDIFIINEDYREFGLNLILPDKRPKEIVIEGCLIKMYWHSEYYAKHYYRRLLNAYYRHHKQRLTDPEYLSEYIPLFRYYNLLCVHSSFGGYLARKVKERYGIPYCITWHGSDIHTNPFEDNRIFKMNVSSMEEAEYNFYVSNALKDTSDKLTVAANKIVLYNGAEDAFYKYSSEKRLALRNELRVNGKKVVAFVGNLYPIKNADLLPNIFKAIMKGYGGDLQFWVIGDGNLREKIEREMIRLGLPCQFFGNCPTSDMPDYMNCIDVLVLPSKNEGMPLVTIEAISCGAHVVGSRAGGIPEVIGDEYCVAFGDFFVVKLAAKVIDMLNNPRPQKLNPDISWNVTAAKENEIYKQILSRNARVKDSN